MQFYTTTSKKTNKTMKVLLFSLCLRRPRIIYAFSSLFGHEKTVFYSHFTRTFVFHFAPSQLAATCFSSSSLPFCASKQNRIAKPKKEEIPPKKGKESKRGILPFLTSAAATATTLERVEYSSLIGRLTSDS